jgi:hypothetical protein
VIFIRAPWLYLKPFLFAEDGLLFQYYYSHRAAATLLHGYAGYISVGHNALGWLIMSLPVAVTPYVFALAALLVNALAFSSVMTWSELFPSPRLRMAVAVLVAAMPLATFAESGVAMYCGWSILIAAAVLSISARPDAPWTRVAGTALLRVLAFVTLPVGLVLVVFDVAGLRRRSWPLRTLHLFVLATAVVYHHFGMMPATTPPFFVAAKLLVLGLLERVAAEAFIGTSLRWWLHVNLPASDAILGLLVLAAFVGLIHRAQPTPEQRRQIAWIAAIAVLYFAAAVAGRGALWDLLGQQAERYVYASKVLMLLAVASMLARVVPPRPQWIALAGAAALVINLLNYGYWRADFAPEATRVAMFTRQLTGLEQQHEGRQGFAASLGRASNGQGMWEVVVDTRSTQ